MEKETSNRRKAAAWAWYLHGGGRESRAATTAVVHRGAGKCRASRFQVEARQRVEQELQEKQRIESYSDLFKSQWDCGSVLFDSYELVALSARLDRGLMSSEPSSLTAFSLKPKENAQRTEDEDSKPGLGMCNSECDEDYVREEEQVKLQYCLPIAMPLVRRKIGINSERRRSLLSKASELFCTSPPQRHQHHFHYHHHFHHHHYS